MQTDIRPSTTTTLPRGPSPLRIRRARLADMPQVAAFIRSSADWYRPFLDEADMGQHEVDEAWGLENYRKREFYIGYDQGEPIGTISVQFLGSYAYLGYIYLDVAHVGKGFGAKLMRFAESIARSRGADGMCLIGHPEATWARRAYLKYGFEIVETERDRVVAWQDGCLRTYYEEGFELYLFPLGTD